MDVKANPAKLNSIRIENINNLDPITVFFENFEPHTGRITVVCYGQSWTAFFGSMSDQTIEQFIKDVPESYLANKLLPYVGSLKVKQEKEMYKYLLRIVNAVQSAL